MNKHHTNLGRTTTRLLNVSRAVTATFDDPIMRSSGCADEFGPSVMADARAAARAVLVEEGFATATEYIGEVRSRCGEKFAYGWLTQEVVELYEVEAWQHLTVQCVESARTHISIPTRPTLCF